MKKTLFIGACVCMALVLTGCKSSKETGYKKAYEKAQAAQAAENEAVVSAPVVQTPVVTPVEETVTAPVQQNVENVAVRTEKLNVVDGSALKNFSVVVGAYSLKANALGHAAQLRQAGYDARVAYNADRNMYRVVASSFDTKAQAVQSRDQLRAKYPEAWLLYQN